MFYVETEKRANIIKRRMKQYSCEMESLVFLITCFPGRKDQYITTYIIKLILVNPVF